MGPSPERLFVGRQREIARIRRELAEGHNLVLTGRFGIGRTSLLRHMAREEGAEWYFVFIDGSQTPARMCEQLFLKLFPMQLKALRRSANPGSFMRRVITTRRFIDRRPHVLVLDDIAKLTHPRFEFIRWLRGLDRFRIIVVTERFLPQGDLWRLRSILVPAPLVTLERLSHSACRQFFETWSVRHGLGWDEGVVQGLARASNGYPLNMWETATAPSARSLLGAPEEKEPKAQVRL